MKVLFLDIDGVLNNDYTKEKWEGFTGVDPELAKRLRDYLSGKDISVVLSSTWRNHPEMLPGISLHGIVWIDKTPSFPGADRGLEIQAWLMEHPGAKTYAILDDNSDMLPEQHPFFVQTYPEEGLTDAKLRQIDSIFFPEVK